MPVTHDHSYVEDFAPGANVLPPRAWLDDDSAKLPLSGDWSFRLSPSVADAAGRPEGPGHLRMGHDRRPGSLAAQRVRRPGVHERASTRSRSSRRTCRPTTRPVTTSGPWRSRRTGPARGWCCGSRGWTRGSRCHVNGELVGWSSGFAAAVGVRRHRPGCPGQGSADRGPRAPVVGRQLCRGPGHVVAVRDLPRGQPAGSEARPRRPTSSSRRRTTTSTVPARCWWSPTYRALSRA